MIAGFLKKLKKIGIVLGALILLSLTSPISGGAEALYTAPSAVVPEGASVVWKIGDMPVWRFPAAYSAEAADLSVRFNGLHRDGFKIEELRVSKVNGKWSLFVADKLLISPDPEHSGAAMLSPHILSLQLMSRIYEAIGGLHANDLTPKYQISGKYSTSGLVSWYGGKFIGKKFANGERFTETHLTAAARELPFGTLVKVTAPSTGKSVVVRITDRFKGHKSRVLDISHAAAELLGIRREGITTAELRVIGRVSSIGGNRR